MGGVTREDDAVYTGKEFLKVRLNDFRLSRLTKYLKEILITNEIKPGE